VLEGLFDVSRAPEGDDDDADVTLRVHVQPAAGRTAVVGRHGDALKLRVAAAPEGGRANEAIRALLASTFGLKPDAVELTSGASSRLKRFRLTGVQLDEFRRRLEQAVADGGLAGPKRGRAPAS
jgi:uncharacterized protein (TIGR00251 family)